MRFAFIQTRARIFHITMMCRVLEVSKAGYYAWRARPLCDRLKEDRALTERIRAIQQLVKGPYGSPRVRMALKVLEIPCGRNRVARLMRLDGLKAKNAPKFRATTDSTHAQPVAPNVLDRQFSLSTNPELAHRDRVCAADITYIPTRGGWLYLAVTLDLVSRRVVGWALRARLDQETRPGRAADGARASWRAGCTASFGSRARRSHCNAYRTAGTPSSRLGNSQSAPVADGWKLVTLWRRRSEASPSRRRGLALAYAHARGVVDRDIRPANGLLSGGRAP